MSEKNTTASAADGFAFTRSNYMWLIAGLGILVIGYILMSGGKSEDPKVFSEAIFNFRQDHARSDRGADGLWHHFLRDSERPMTHWEAALLGIIQGPNRVPAREQLGAPGAGEILVRIERCGFDL